MKWILALLVSAGMFYTGYHHASRYVEVPDVDPAEAEPKPPNEDPPPPIVTPAPAPPIAETVAPAPTSPEGDSPSLTPAPDIAPDADPDMQADPLAGSEGPGQGGLEDLDFHSAEARSRSDAPILDRALAAALGSGDWSGYRASLQAAFPPFALECANSSRDIDGLLKELKETKS